MNGERVQLLDHRWGFEGLYWKDVNREQLGELRVVHDLWKNDMAA